MHMYVCAYIYIYIYVWKLIEVKPWLHQHGIRGALLCTSYVFV